MPEEGTSASEQDPGSALAVAARRVATGMIDGLLCGLVIGGIGGRLAMLLLRLTSGASVRGLKTDDEFTIGRFSADTVFLLITTALLGAFAALVYLAIRRWLPRPGRQWLSGAFFGAAGGAAFVEPGGIDFTLLDPKVLAVALFVALPALYGIAVAALIERRERQQRPPRAPLWLVLLALAPLLITGPFAAGLLLVFLIVWALSRSDAAVRIWRSTTVEWTGRAALVAITGLAAFELASDIADIL